MTEKNNKKHIKFEGYVEKEGDDPYCWGVHQILVDKDGKSGNPNALYEYERNHIDFLDEILKEGKKYKITITVEEI